MLQIVSWICWISNNNWNVVGTTFATFLEILAQPRKNDQPKSFFISITLEDIHLDWLNCFLSLVFSGILFLILIGFMLFLSPFLDLIMVPMLPVSLLKQLGPGIICQQEFSFDFLFLLRYTSELWSKLLYAQIVWCQLFGCPKTNFLALMKRHHVNHIALS